jgi:hypothetical protein
VDRTTRVAGQWVGLAIVLLTFALVAGAGRMAYAQSWQALTNQPPNGVGVGAVLLLSDGTVIAHEEDGNSGSVTWQYWFKLTPDINGSYANGTWKQIASMPANYGPLYFGSAVLKNGQVIVEGGEYNFGNPVWTNQGALYNPKTNKWIAIAPPIGWGTIGDAQGVNLANGKYMQANCCSTQSAFFNPGTRTWTATGAGKADGNDEEGWTLLPNGEVLTVDAYTSGYSATGKRYEIYNPATGAWTSPGSTPVQLWDSAAGCGGSGVASYEVGPAVLRPDGTVFATGANSCGAGHTAIYNSSTGTWTAGPNFTGTFDVADGPAALEVNGKVIVMTSPGIFNLGATFYEWNGSSLTTVLGPPNSTVDSSYYGHFLELPTGQLLFTDFSNDVEVFTPSGSYQAAWRPVVSTAPASVTHGVNGYKLTGTQLNGLSQGAAYGDDFQDATNFPLVRIVNNSTGHVFYCRTRSFSSMGVATGTKIVSTLFDVPAGIEVGASTLYVVANGIPSTGTAITVN